ncbi:MAG: hypothetical protein RL346_1616 [Verrucomicrobiota bacterium]|jgi:hypothetical protein
MAGYEREYGREKTESFALELIQQTTERNAVRRENTRKAETITVSQGHLPPVSGCARQPDRNRGMSSQDVYGGAGIGQKHGFPEKMRLFVSF